MAISGDHRKTVIAFAGNAFEFLAHGNGIVGLRFIMEGQHPFDDERCILGVDATCTSRRP